MELHLYLLNALKNYIIQYIVVLKVTIFLRYKVKLTPGTQKKGKGKKENHF